MPNLYVDIDAFRRLYQNNATLDSADQTEILRVLEAGSRAVDEFCNRYFYADIGTRVFDGNGRDKMFLPDLLAASSIKLDENTDGTFELTLTTADYWLQRQGFRDMAALPATLIRLNTNGQRSVFLDYPQILQIAGTWGFTQATELDLKADGTQNLCAISGTTTTIMTTGEAGGLAVGQTLLIESEQVYVRVKNSATEWVVIRAVNGTTAASHASKPMYRYVYIPQVVQATAMQSYRYWQRRGSGSPTVINTAAGTIESFIRLDPDVAALLMPYRRIPV